jgi:hypothetical protein
LRGFNDATIFEAARTGQFALHSFLCLLSFFVFCGEIPAFKEL